MIRLPLCDYCKHFKGVRNKCVYLCDAFSEGVPNNFYGDKKKCNNDIHFELKDGKKLPSGW